jgi:iron only hydrogenase large subunit-like protein
MRKFPGEAARVKFKPCQDACTHDGTHCQGCGRSHEEVAATKALVASVVQFTLDNEFENIEEFTTYVAIKAARKVRAALAEREGDSPVSGIKIGN